MSTEPSSRPVFSQQLILSPLFTGVLGRGILRSSHSGHSPKLDFHFTEFLEVHHQGNTRPFMVTIPKDASPTRRRRASIPPANRLGPRRSAPPLPSTGSRARPVRARAASDVQPSRRRTLRPRRRIRGGCPWSGRGTGCRFGGA